MKKTITMLLLAMVAMTAIVLTVYAAANIGEIYFEPIATEEGEILPMANCGNHVWVLDRPGNGIHRLVCNNSGCTARMTEECYNNYPCSKHGTAYTTCQVCDWYGVVVNHTLEYRSNYDGTHDRKCVFADEYGYGPCAYCPIDDEPCTHGSYQVFSDYSNYGHPAGTKCINCKEFHLVEYVTPAGHANGFDINCDYCVYNESIFDLLTDLRQARIARDPRLSPYPPSVFHYYI